MLSKSPLSTLTARGSYGSKLKLGGSTSLSKLRVKSRGSKSSLVSAASSRGGSKTSLMTGTRGSTSQRRDPALSIYQRDRLSDLENQVAEARKIICALTEENRTLLTVQKRQDKAIKETTQSDLTVLADNLRSELRAAKQHTAKLIEKLNVAERAARDAHSDLVDAKDRLRSMKTELDVARSEIAKVGRVGAASVPNLSGESHSRSVSRLSVNLGPTKQHGVAQRPTHSAASLAPIAKKATAPTTAAAAAKARQPLAAPSKGKGAQKPLTIAKKSPEITNKHPTIAEEEGAASEKCDPAAVSAEVVVPSSKPTSAAPSEVLEEAERGNAPSPLVFSALAAPGAGLTTTAAVKPMPTPVRAAPALVQPVVQLAPTPILSSPVATAAAANTNGSTRNVFRPSFLVSSAGPSPPPAPTVAVPTPAPVAVLAAAVPAAKETPLVPNALTMAKAEPSPLTGTDNNDDQDAVFSSRTVAPSRPVVSEPFSFSGSMARPPPVVLSQPPTTTAAMAAPSRPLFLSEAAPMPALQAPASRSSGAPIFLSSSLQAVASDRALPSSWTTAATASTAPVAPMTPTGPPRVFSFAPSMAVSSGNGGGASYVPSFGGDSTGGGSNGAARVGRRGVGMVFPGGAA